jgi:hypothetical protein
MSMPFGSHVQEEFAMTPSADEGRKIAEKVLPQSETSWTKEGSSGPGKAR